MKNFRRKSIRLYWSGGRRGRINYGDYINRYIVEHLTGVAIDYASPSRADMAAAGSILHLLVKHNWKRPLKGRLGRLFVWGSGSMQPVPLTGFELLDVRVVRGPMTRDAAGLPADTPLGDPGLLAPLLLKARPNVEARWGLIPHVSDRSSPAVAQMMANTRHVKLINLANPDPIAVTREIASCEAILSSSLHGLIVADAFGLPSARLKLSDLIEGGDWKYNDYFASVGRTKTSPLIPDDMGDEAVRLARLEIASGSRVAAITKTLLVEFDRMGIAPARVS